MRQTLFFLGILIPLIFLTACQVGPKYHPVKIDTYPCWEESFEDNSQSRETPIANWWNQFQDPYLNVLIEDALQQNQDIQKAMIRIMEARARRRITSSRYFPQIDEQISYDHISISKNTVPFNPQSLNQQGVNQPILFQFDQEIYTLGLDALWEIDLFGRIKHRVESATAQIGSAIEDKNAIILSTISEVALNYFELRGKQKQIALLQLELKHLKKKLGLLRKKYDSGIVDLTDLDLAEEELAQRKILLDPLYADVKSHIYTLTFLTGKKPIDFMHRLQSLYPLPSIPDQIPLGFPSELLCRRPDVRKAERDLAASVAEIGVATSELFPNLTITGNLGLRSLKFGTLFQDNSFYWSIGNHLLQPLFHGGKLRASVALQKLIASEAFVNYKQTVFRALKESESAISMFLGEKKSFEHSLRVSSLSKSVSEKKGLLYESGIKNALYWIDAEVSKLRKEQETEAKKVVTLESLVFLYKALGGGWEREL